MDAYPIFSNPRIVAGDDYAGDIFKCHLQSVSDAIAAGVYAPVDVSDDRRALQRIFPDGVCDYVRGDVARVGHVWFVTNLQRLNHGLRNTGVSRHGFVGVPFKLGLPVSTGHEYG